MGDFILDISDFPKGWSYTGTLDTDALFCLPLLPCYEHIGIATATFSSESGYSSQEIREYANTHKATEEFEDSVRFLFFGHEDPGSWVIPEGFQTQNLIADQYKIGCKVDINGLNCRMAAQYRVYIVEFLFRDATNLDSTVVNKILEAIDTNMLGVYDE